MKAVSAMELSHTLAGNGLTGKAKKKAGKRIGYNYIILKSLKESRKNDVVKCLYIKSLTNFGICVIKEGTYGDSKDSQGRDIKDRLIWQKQLHERLQDKLRIPRLLGTFEENGNYYLVIERIKGKSLYNACKEHAKDLREALLSGNKPGLTFLDYLIRIVGLLETLHSYHIVHRDVTAANFMIMPNGKVAIIDMELSYSLQHQFPAPPFQLGTYGYMSPQQEAMLYPAIEEDIFSVGAIMIQVWTGISPVKLTNGSVESMAERVHFFVPDKAFANIVIQCLQPEAEKRPTLSAVREVIINYRNDLKKKKKRDVLGSVQFNREQIIETIQHALHTFGSPLLADKERGWFSEDKQMDQVADKKRINRAWYASFNVGAAGVIYMLSKAYSVGMDVSATQPYILKALELIERKYIDNIENARPGLHFGSAGIAATLSDAILQELIVPEAKHFDWINKLLDKENNILDIMDGIAGQGMAHWICQPFLHPARIKERLDMYVSHLLAKQERDGSWSKTVKNKKKATRGFAHGVAGIIYFLLEYAYRYNEPRALSGAEHGLHWLTKKAISRKGAIQWLSSTDREIAPWWCEGSTGIGLTFMSAYKMLHEPKYKEYAIGALNNHHYHVLNNNLSQCHGLSGLGEIYLEAYNCFADIEWLDRAGWIVQTLMHLRKQDPSYGPYWLVEHERQPVAGFMIGNSGILHFLLRYCYPGKIGFPLTNKI